MGSFVAENLARQGVKTLLLERRGNDTPPICTGIIGVEVERLISVPPEAVYSEVKSVSLTVAFQRQLEYSSHSTLAYVVNRQVFDRRMLERALTSGAELLHASLKGAQFHPPGLVELEVSQGEARQTITTRLLVLATGYSPLLLERLGMEGYPGTTQGAQVEVSVPTNRDTIEVYFSNRVVPKGFLWVVPLGEETARVGLVTPNGGVELLREALEKGFLNERVKEFQPERIRMRPLPRGPIPRSYANGILAVGEAAGQLKATTYGGIYYGLLCGQCAVNTALTALNLERSSQEVLATYETQWRAKIGEELSQGARWRNLFESMSDEQMVIAADIVGGDGIFNKVKSAVKFDWHKDVIGLGLSLLRRHGLGVVHNSMPGRER